MCDTCSVIEEEIIDFDVDGFIRPLLEEHEDHSIDIRAIGNQMMHVQLNLMSGFNQVSMKKNWDQCFKTIEEITQPEETEKTQDSVSETVPQALENKPALSLEELLKEKQKNLMSEKTEETNADIEKTAEKLDNLFASLVKPTEYQSGKPEEADSKLNEKLDKWTQLLLLPPTTNLGDNVQ